MMDAGVFFGYMILIAIFLYLPISKFIFFIIRRGWAYEIERDLNEEELAIAERRSWIAGTAFSLLLSFAINVFRLGMPTV